MRRPRLRLLPLCLAAMTLLLGVKLAQLLSSAETPSAALGLLPTARASAPEAPPPPTPPRSAAAPPRPIEPPAPSPEEIAERKVLESLRARRAEIDAREQAAAARELVLAAAERRLTQRIEEMAALQQRLEAADHARSDREEAGWKQMVKLYESMRPRDAATIFDELDMPVLVQLLGRMREAKAAPIVGAMKPQRARQVTAELSRQRARSID